MKATTGFFWAAAAMPFAAAAQEAPAAPEATGMTIQQIIETGGWLMYVLAAMSVIGLAMILYFFFMLRRQAVMPAAYIDSVRGLVKEGRLVEAQAASRSQGSAVASILTAALDYVVRSEKPEPGMLREVLEGEGGRQATLMQNQAQYLLDIAVVAPMVGLLGTVMGMLRAFNSVALDLAKAKPMILAAGVSQALVTTVAGLLVAIPAMLAYAYFRNRVSRVISDLESECADIATMILEKKRP